MLIRTLLVTALAAAVLALGASAATPRLVAVVGPGFNITLTKGGKKVTSLPAGKYTVAVSDKSNIHNFHLKGPGVNKDSGVEKTGASTWAVALKKGSYVFVCDPHATSMKGGFKVT